MGEPMLTITNGSKSLPDGSPLLRDVHFNVAKGRSAAIVGRSGTGKSSLLSILGHLDSLDSGSYFVDGVLAGDMKPSSLDRARATQFGFIFQRFALIPHLSALENVLLPLRHLGGRSDRAMRVMGRDALVGVGLEGMAHRPPRRLSGGEQQRVAIARALVHNPDVVLADEPTGSLDYETGMSVIDTLQERVAELGTTLVTVTHDSNVASRMDEVFTVENLTLTRLSRERQL
jgi:ABC-type lipoprotein export system ATPase subunit